MVNGPNVLVSPKHKLNLRSRTGSCNLWNSNPENLVALDLAEHDFGIDVYIFSIYSLAERRLQLVGWILFDELINESGVVVEDKTIYLTIPIKKLHSLEKENFEKFKYPYTDNE